MKRSITKQKPQILLTTVGTSLLGNLSRAPEQSPLRDGYTNNEAQAVAEALLQLDPAERTNGAELCSIHSLIINEHVPTNCGIFLFHSATDEGRFVASVVTKALQARKHTPVAAVEIADLQDSDPKRFRTKGLRNLAKQLCQKVHEYGPGACAFNATGGYKAQIAIAVILGQALGISTFYMHERFSEIIAFPPMPVALDFEVWMKSSGLLQALESNREPAPKAMFEEEWDERFDTLVEQVEIDGVTYIEFSATGQIFHETFRQKFRTSADQVLPPPASTDQKKSPTLKKGEGHMLAHQDELLRFLQKVTEEVPQVIHCSSSYYNPDLPNRTRFVPKQEHIEGIYSNGTWTVRFRVETTAHNEGQRNATVAHLNEWLTRDE